MIGADATRRKIQKEEVREPREAVTFREIRGITETE
jgi:hypothetical protein